MSKYMLNKNGKFDQSIIEKTCSGHLQKGTFTKTPPESGLALSDSIVIVCFYKVGAVK